MSNKHKCQHKSPKPYQAKEKPGKGVRAIDYIVGKVLACMKPARFLSVAFHMALQGLL